MKSKVRDRPKLLEKRIDMETSRRRKMREIDNQKEIERGRDEPLSGGDIGGDIVGASELER